MYTEDEAREKWCPHARMLESYGERASYNRAVSPSGGDEEASTKCIGSACMAWRWKPGDNRRGYCGLSGSPYMGGE